MCVCVVFVCVISSVFVVLRMMVAQLPEVLDALCRRAATLRNCKWIRVGRSGCAQRMDMCTNPGEAGGSTNLRVLRQHEWTTFQSVYVRMS